MDSSRFAFPRFPRSSRFPFAATPRAPAAIGGPLLVDPVSRYCLVAPLLRRELDELRGRRGTPAERRGDHRQQAATSRRLADLLCVTFAQGPGV
jgi:hypothetical protein